MPIRELRVTVEVDGVSCSLALSDFRDGGAAVLAELPKRAAIVAQEAAKLLKDQLDGVAGLEVAPVTRSDDDLFTPPPGCSGKADCNCEACQTADAADRAQRPDGYAE